MRALSSGARGGASRRRTAVVKPSEMSRHPDGVVTEALHERGLPRGVVNIVKGRWKTVARSSVRTPTSQASSQDHAVGKRFCALPRRHLRRDAGIGGQSHHDRVDDAKFAKPCRLRLGGFMNSGSSVHAPLHRILVPQARLSEFEEGAFLDAVRDIQGRRPARPSPRVYRPMFSRKRKQWDRGASGVYPHRHRRRCAACLPVGRGRPHGVNAGLVRTPYLLQRCEERYDNRAS